MKKCLIACFALCIAGVVWADQSSVSPAGYTYPPPSYQGVVTISGKPGATKNVSVTDNTAVTLPAIFATAGGTFLNNGVTPIGAWISCVTDATHWTFGGTTPSATVGHALPAGTWLVLSNPEAVSTAKIFGKDGGAIVCVVTLQY